MSSFVSVAADKPALRYKRWDKMMAMTGAPPEYRLYQDLAPWWPLISPPEEYAEEAAYLAPILGSGPAARPEVLDLGSGGGHVAVHLKERLALTLVDLSAQMLSSSRRLNPECAHLEGDMRTVRLGRAFDAVLVHDAIDYITSEADLRQVIETAFAHCRPGGIAVFVPDYTADTFHPDNGHGGSSDPSGRQASFQEWMWDPDPADTWIQVEYEFELREADGTVQVVREGHRLGAFSRAAWRRVLTEGGFDLQTGLDPETGPGLAASRGTGGAPPQATKAGRPRNLFVGRRPG
jgi:SAM-dependent methyltransferase